MPGSVKTIKTIKKFSHDIFMIYFNDIIMLRETLIKEYTSALGVSGCEKEIRNIIKADVEGLGETKIDKLGNFILHKRGEGKTVIIGDFGVFASNFVVNGDKVSLGAMDNRVSCYIQIEAAKRMKQGEYDAHFVFIVQEETFQSGAATSAYAIEPDAAIVVDVTATGDTPNCPRMAVKLGNGAAIKIMDRGMITHPKMKKFLEETAVKHNIKFQFEVLEFGGKMEWKSTYPKQEYQQEYYPSQQDIFTLQRKW